MLQLSLFVCCCCLSASLLVRRRLDSGLTVDVRSFDDNDITNLNVYILSSRDPAIIDSCAGIACCIRLSLLVKPAAIAIRAKSSVRCGSAKA